MDRFLQMRVFVAVAEEEGFAKAAKRLGMSAPAVTRTISMLETRLGMKLLQRTTRFVRATELGTRYLADCKRILVEADELEERVTGTYNAPKGHLTITAPGQFGRMYVVPYLADFMQQYPDITAHALLVDRLVSLLEEGIDVGIRIGELPDSNMRAIKVGSTQRLLCASPAYLAAHGTPQKPEDLEQHRIVAFSNFSKTVEWSFQKDGAKQTTRLRPILSISSTDGTIAAVTRNMGIARLLSYQIAPLLQAGELKVVLADYALENMPIHIIHREGRYATAKIRAFVDYFAEHLKKKMQGL